jgi:hypothetical protein
VGDTLSALQAKVDHHILEQEAFNAHVVSELKVRQEQFDEISTKLDTVIANTQNVVQLDRDWEGAMRLGSGLRAFVWWLMKLGAGGVAVAGGILYLAEKISTTNWQ